MNHPNRSRRANSPARNPTPDEIKAWREAAGLTQSAAAKLVFAALRTWQQWEAGDRKMHPCFWEHAQMKMDR